jgi:glycosyltransferase involved in cell wall biosynthesis
VPKKGVEVLAAAAEGPLSRWVSIRGFADDRAMAAFRIAHPGCAATLETFAPGAREFLRGVDVIIVPSVCLENQPSVIIESFAEGRPVVASRVGGIPEMFVDGRGGWLLPPGDVPALRACLTRLEEHPDEIVKVAAGIPPWPSWEEVSRKVVRELDLAIGRAGRRGRTRGRA